MREIPNLLHFLSCSHCHADLVFDQIEVRSNDGHIITGSLKCGSCKMVFPITRGIPRFVKEILSETVSQTVKGFSFEWKHANKVIQNKLFTSAETFLDFIYPLKSEDFSKKTILDVGCGTGRFSRLAQQFGASFVVGMDLGDSVEVAFENTRGMENILIIQADVFTMPLKPVFDMGYSIGVLHHTADPAKAFKALSDIVRPGGEVVAWVYGLENNAWIISILNRIRTNLTSRLPHGALLALSYTITAAMFPILQGLYVPVGKLPILARLRKRLFYFEYLFFLAGFGFHEQVYIVFDHLVPSLAAYIPRQEFSLWFSNSNLKDVVISSRNGNSWRGYGRKGPGERIQ